jgi:uncharacterized protein YdcH (DUF465 family)
MSHTPHELTDEFPDHAERIHDLCGSDAHFQKICDDYHTLNREIHRGETDIQPMDDVHLENLKKQRLKLLDEIAARLS